ncbi:ribonuclease J [Rhizobium sp. KVB221]|uniref:Ribonuclease J n=1 Tax=Rhizobium setariae TaxID=2801340 RepID=A0A936YTP0_9HYPH|nr:ribonuclease J [Rhizobium setariae]MBL0372841.1 ribonuclease J [Rhizobium setariae]
MAGNDELVFLPLGGVGEIGMNLALYGFGPSAKRQWIMVDCGVSFAGPELPGVELILPDIKYVETIKKDLLGLFITHAHEDHYGAVRDLWPRLNVPLYASPFTEGLLEAKGDYDKSGNAIPVQTLQPGMRIEVGPFTIEPITVAHSIPEAMALLIRTPLGNVVHTGDWKIDPAPSLGSGTDEARFKEIGDEGVLALICDSTNAQREGDSPSEMEVSASLADIIRNAAGRVAVTTFSSNVGRIKSIALAAEQAGREVMLLGSSMRRVTDVARDLNMLEGMQPFIAEDEFGYLPRENAVVILTGSQGEARAALAKIARDEMRNIGFTKGDTFVFSSRPIPGNEKAILDIKNALIDQGMIVISDTDTLVHVSGHPRRNELKRMYEWVRPQILVPVHGEAAHLHAHAELGRATGIPDVAEVRNGRMLRLAPGPATIVAEAPHGRIFKDGNFIGDVDEMGIGERRKLSFAGHVAVNVILDSRYDFIDDPDVTAFGLPAFDEDGEDMEDLLYDAVLGAVESIPRVKRKDLDMVKEAVRRSVRSAANNSWGKKPIVTVFVTRV